MSTAEPPAVQEELKGESAVVGDKTSVVSSDVILVRVEVIHKLLLSIEVSKLQGVKVEVDGSVVKVEKVSVVSKSVIVAGVELVQVLLMSVRVSKVTKLETRVEESRLEVE